MITVKILLFIFSLFYDFYLFSYSKWENNIKQNKFGSFFIRLCIVLNIGVLITSFLDKFYYTI